jgi:uncharacterized repeat protein (TIGR01451 family)
VHANQLSLNTSFGGIITVKSTGGNVTASGLAIQANAPKPGGTGGTISIGAKGNVILDEAQILAKGDMLAAGGFGIGGTVEARAFSGILSWANLPGGVTATGDVQPTGRGVPAARSGVIFLTSCVGDPINTSNTSFPVTLGTFTTPLFATSVCSPAAPELPIFVLLPERSCVEGEPDAVKTATQPTVIVGGTASYTIKVTAGGDADSTNVKLTDVLPGPASMSWTVGGADAGFCSPNPVAGGSTLTCNFGTMAQGTLKTITLSSTTTAANCPSIANTATISADADSNPGNNSSGPITITVNCAPDVSVTKTATTPTVTVGGTASYSITVSAGGTGSSTNVKLTDVLPGSASMSWTVGGANAGSCSPNPVAGGSTLTCNFDTMAQGTTKTITLSAVTTAANCPSIANPLHKVDNQGGRHDYVLFEFSSPVVMDRVFLDSIGADSDISVWIGTKTDPFNNHITLSDAVLTSLGSREDNNTTSTGTSRTADINAGAASGNVLVIAASTSDTTPDDEFKISQLVLTCQ